MKQIIGLSVALVAALAASYWTWTDTSEKPSDDAVALYDASAADLKSVTYTTDTLTVSIEKRKDDKGEYIWVDSTEKKLPKKPKSDLHPGAEEQKDGAKADGDGEEDTTDDGTGPLAPEPEEPPKIEHTAFVASSQGQDLWTSFAPLHAMRELETPSDPSVFGLDQPKGTLEVKLASGGGTTLKLGGETYGSKDRYVGGEGGHVYLVDDAVLKPLEFAASRILERNLFPLEEHQIDAVSVTTRSGTTLSWNHVNKDDAAKAFWARPDSPDTDDGAGGTWIGKLLKLKLRDYVVDPSTLGDLTSVASYSVSGDGKTWKVEILKDATDPPHWYAKSDFNRGTVSLTESLVKDLVSDLDDLAQQ